MGDTSAGEGVGAPPNEEVPVLAKAEEGRQEGSAEEVGEGGGRHTVGEGGTEAPVVASGETHLRPTKSRRATVRQPVRLEELDEDEEGERKPEVGVEGAKGAEEEGGLGLGAEAVHTEVVEREDGDGGGVRAEVDEGDPASLPVPLPPLPPAAEPLSGETSEASQESAASPHGQQ